MRVSAIILWDSRDWLFRNGSFGAWLIRSIQRVEIGTFLPGRQMQLAQARTNQDTAELKLLRVIGRRRVRNSPIRRAGVDQDVRQAMDSLATRDDQMRAAQEDLDLAGRELMPAQDMRRASWHILYFDYRGSWGSPGVLSFTHGIEDPAAAVAFLCLPALTIRPSWPSR